MGVSRIETTEVIPYALRFREPYVTARGRIDRREMVLLRLTSDDGTVGLGEAVPLALRGDAPLEQVATQLEHSAATLRGLEIEPDRRLAGRRLAPLEAGRSLVPAVRAALEVALLDLAARAGEVPLWRLLSAERVAPVPLNATLAAGEPAEVAARALEYAGRGFGTVKLKLGIGDEIDLAVVAAVREACGEELRIRVDANEAWSLEHATAMLRSLEPLGLELVEQPVVGLVAMSELRTSTRARLAADEAVTDVDSASTAWSLGACEAVGVKLSKVGGIDTAFAIGRRLPIYLSSALDGPVGIAAAAHVAAVRGGEYAHGLATLDLFADSIGPGPPIENGAIRLGESPGLGVEIDPAALDAARI